MLEVKPATDNDIPALLELIHEFQAESLDEYNLFCDDEVAKAVMPVYIPNTLVLLKDGYIIGVIAGTIVKYPLSNEDTFQEAIWYVTKDFRKYGIKLLRELERRCKDNGIKNIVMVHLGDSKSEKLERFYKKCGYRMCEIQYIKKL